MRSFVGARAIDYNRSMTPRLLVTGAGGMVGSYAKEIFTDHELILTDIVDGLPRLDVCDPVEVKGAVAELKPAVVLHLAAATDVDRCEQEPDGAQYGLYHLANKGCGTRYEVALKVRALLGRPEVEIVPVPSAQFPLPAPRARFEAMRNLKLELLGIHARTWEDALQEYVSTELVPLLT